MIDHRRLGRELELFCGDPLVGAGLPIWLPAGAAMRHSIEDYLYELERLAGYQHVYSPVIAKREMFERSGHLAKFADDMFAPMVDGDEAMMLRPSLCPHHAMVFRSRGRSYRELPLRIAELGGMYRSERSGVLGGMSRVRSRTAAWIKATAMRTEPTMFAGKDHVNPAAGALAAQVLWRTAGITDPLSQVDVAEIYVPFSWYEPMWLENLGFAVPGEGWRLTESGDTAIGGRIPVNPSGGVLCSNPIGASGLLRFGEAAMQVMGRAGEHQVAGARTALGHAYGGGSQYFSMWIVSSER